MLINRTMLRAALLLTNIRIVIGIWIRCFHHTLITQALIKIALHVSLLLFLLLLCQILFRGFQLLDELAVLPERLIYFFLLYEVNIRLIDRLIGLLSILISLCRHVIKKPKLQWRSRLLLLVAFVHIC